MIPVVLKQGVDVDSLARVLWHAVSVAAAVYEDLGATELVITSGRDGQHRQDSLHYEGRAVDLRIWNLEPTRVDEAARRIRNVLGRAFDVLIESTHIHIEADRI